MNKIKFLILIIIGLVISNALVLFMLNRDHLRKDGPKKFIIHKLHFDAEQIKKYESYIKIHRKSIEENEKLMAEKRDKLYRQLQFDTNSSQVDSLIMEVSKQQYVIEKLNYDHFLKIKRLCKPAQENDFKELSNEIGKLFLLPQRK